MSELTDLVRQYTLPDLCFGIDLPDGTVSIIPQTRQYSFSDYIPEAQRQGRLQQGFHSGIIDKSRTLFGDLFNRYEYMTIEPAKVTIEMLTDSNRSPFSDDDPRYEGMGMPSVIAQEVLTYWDSFSWLWGINDDQIDLYTVFHQKAGDGRLGDTQMATRNLTDYTTLASYIDPRRRK